MGDLGVSGSTFRSGGVRGLAYEEARVSDLRIYPLDFSIQWFWV